MQTRFASLDLADFALPRSIEERTQTPALVISLERVRENLRRVLARTGPDRWRPHLKTTKIPQVWRELLQAGVHSFKCATTREAEHALALFRREHVPGTDLLVAYPLIGPSLERLGILAEGFPETRVSVLCEDPEHVERVPRAVSIFVDVNPGMHRTGVPAEDAETVLAVARAAGRRFRGLHFYEGHLHDGDLVARERDVHASLDVALALRDHLLANGLQVEELVTSGTPAFLHALRHPRLAELEGTRHRVSPGTVVLNDLRTEQENPELDLLPAACVLTRVVSHPSRSLATCDAGSKAIAAEAGDPCAFVLGHPELTARTPNEEHLPLYSSGPSRPDRGSVLYLVPQHVCPTVNLAETALVVDGARIERVSVSARAHDV